MLDPMGAERDQIMEIATLIPPWCRDGNYGCLFDGTSNLSLTGKVAHFELGYILESAEELKAAAGFLITNHARKHMFSTPRSTVARGSRLPHTRRDYFEKFPTFAQTWVCFSRGSWLPSRLGRGWMPVSPGFGIAGFDCSWVSD